MPAPQTPQEQAQVNDVVTLPPRPCSTYFPQLTLTERLQAQCGSGFAAE
jgi:hypothetical protein